MDYWSLLIASIAIALAYLTVAGVSYFKYRHILDPFMKSNIIIYIVAFTAKPLFWFFSWRLEIYNQSIQNTTSIPLVPIRSTLGAAISGMCFLILHVIIIRIVLAFYHLKAESDEERMHWSKRTTKGLFIHIGVYIIIVSA